ncbi:MAG: hypothetical protein CMK92_04235 [Pseudomonas sp.]|nr:hypothetical protein [Pseudomonas sp.]
MKIRVRKKRSITKHPDGTIEYGPEPTEEEQHKAQARAEDQQVSQALEHFHVNRDLAPLLELFQEANPAILRSKIAIDLIFRAASGEKLVGRGRVRTKQDIEDDLHIAKAVYWLKKVGAPEMNSKETNINNPSACLMVGQRISLSDTAVYSIVKKVNYSPSIFDWPPFDTSSPKAILQQFFPTPEEEADIIQRLVEAGDNRYE